MRIETLDLMFQDTPHVIAAFLIHAPDGPVLIETGPATTLPTLTAALDQRGIRPADVRDVLVTHIHLDHAGAAGWWARQGARVHVHADGAPHLVDPSKLLRSASRIYGERMDELWGEVLPVPADRIRPLADGAIVEAGGIRIEAIETPGHARHHHVFRLDDVAFTGDAAGIMLPGNHWIDLPAPPPEFDLEAWRISLSRLRGLRVSTLYRTHFDATSNVDAELEAFSEVLEGAVEWMRELVERGLSREQMVVDFSARMRHLAVSHGASASAAHAYELANPRVMSVDGIVRYLTKAAKS